MKLRLLYMLTVFQTTYWSVSSQTDLGMRTSDDKHGMIGSLKVSLLSLLVEDKP